MRSARRRECLALLAMPVQWRRDRSYARPTALFAYTARGSGLQRSGQLRHSITDANGDVSTATVN